MELLILVLILFFFFISGAPLFGVILGVALVGDHMGGGGGRPLFSDVGTNVLDIFSMGMRDKAAMLTPIPLFILTGYILAEAKTAERMVRAARAALGWLPGGLAVVTIFACALFTTFTGASGVTIVALGGLILPALIKEQYPERFSLGLVAGTGSVGLLFPPAVPLIVYSIVYGLAYQGVRKEDPTAIPVDLERFLFAGIVPGLVLLAILCIFVVIVAKRRGVPRHAFDFGELGRALSASIPELIFPFLIIAGLAKGIDIAEISALAVVYILIVEVVYYRDIRLRDLVKISRESMALVGAIFIIIFAATALANYFVTAQIPNKLVTLFTSNIATDQWWLFLLAVNVILLMAGMVMDIFSAIVIIVPLLAIPANKYGINPYHLGIIFLLNLEIGYITPPVGLNLFVTSFKFRKPMVDVTRATMPFLFCMILALGIVTYIPALTVVPPEKPTGTAAVLVEMVHTQHETLGVVAQVTLPDGTIKKFTECEAIADQLGRDKCEGVFLDVTNCRKKGGPDAKKCETEALEAYVKSVSSDIDNIDLLANPAGDGGDELLAPGGDDDDDDDDGAVLEPPPGEDEPLQPPSTGTP